MSADPLMHRCHCLSLSLAHITDGSGALSLVAWDSELPPERKPGILGSPSASSSGSAAAAASSSPSVGRVAAATAAMAQGVAGPAAITAAFAARSPSPSAGAAAGDRPRSPSPSARSGAETKLEEGSVAQPAAQLLLVSSRIARSDFDLLAFVCFSCEQAGRRARSACVAGGHIVIGLESK